MANRLQEVHPSLVHFPLALHPLAVATDTLGYLSGDRRLMKAGRWAAALAAAGALLAGSAGFLAQREVEAEGEAHDILVRHRTINLGLAVAMGALAAWRWRRKAPTAGSLAMGGVAFGVMAYSAYLGGTLVYEHGVGVRPAGGLKRDRDTAAWLDGVEAAATEEADERRDALRHAGTEHLDDGSMPHFNGHEPGDEVGY